MRTATPKVGLSARVQDANARLDAHVRDIIEWHFNHETGCPFWLDFASRLNWDPRREIHRFADLRKYEADTPYTLSRKSHCPSSSCLVLESAYPILNGAAQRHGSPVGGTCRRWS